MPLGEEDETGNRDPKTLHRIELHEALLDHMWQPAGGELVDVYCDSN